VFQSVIENAHVDNADFYAQAQPNKIRLKGKDNEKYEEKLLVKAKVISDAASKIWSELS
jgi:DNA polymerase theta